MLGTFGALALLAITVSACGGSGAPPAAESSAVPLATAQTSTAAPAPTATPTPTPTPTAKAYTSGELAAIVGQVRDDADRRLSVLPSGDIAAALEETKAMISSISVEPAECQELAAASTVPSVEDATMAIGMSTDSATGAMAALSLVAGLDQSALAQVSDSGQLAKCSSMTMTASGITVAVTITPVEGASGLPGAIAYRTDTALPDGSTQSIVRAQVVHHGMLITSVAAGGDSGADAVRRAGALLDSAAAQVQ
ncbi:hypothetical protein [Arthrobacter sp. Soil764]|uniref:hypothetical protein n=1 Tax=Arthrobacter sp. Soil764 TaxID=1736403 RepID=UPI000B168E93|nr:hypothetical protein [Arthrobacter sp. Soil764]